MLVYADAADHRQAGKQQDEKAIASDPRHRPAVIAECGSVGRDACYVATGRQRDGEHGTQADARDMDPAMIARQLIEGHFDRCQPVGPPGGQQQFVAAAMPRDQRCVDGAAGTVQPLTQRMHFGRHAGQAVEQKHRVLAGAIEKDAARHRFSA